VRATSRKLGLKTEASMRFERGADIAAPVVALGRALALLHEIGAGRATGGLTDVYPTPAGSIRIALRRQRVAHLLGQPVPDADIRRILGGLGFVLTPDAEGWEVGPPSFRVDIGREADLIEEVARHWGYDRIPATLPPFRSAPPAGDLDGGLERRLCGLARAAGLQEAVTFTFIERPAAEPFAAPSAGLMTIANPLSEKFAVLRPSLLPGLLDALVYNRRRAAEHVRLFELGSVFSDQGESTRLGWVLTGGRLEHWSGNTGPADFFDAKGIAELIAQGCGVGPNELRAVPADGRLPWFVRGRGAQLEIDGRPDVPVGHIGELRPDIVALRGLDSGAVVGGEVDLSAIREWRDDSGAPQPIVRPVPRFPSIVRDLSILVSERLPAAEVRGTIRANAPSTLAGLVEFDRYQGKGVPEGQVSLSIRLTFRAPDRTLTDGEVQQAIDALVAALTREHGATLRGT
jgi:phenylalanyl-tRNA synthetase beta chain